MLEQLWGLNALADNSLSVSSLSSSNLLIEKQCEKLLSLVSNKTTVSNDQQVIPLYFRQLLEKKNSTFRLPKTLSDCTKLLTHIVNSTNESNITKEIYGVQERSRSLIVFVILIAFVSLISIIGNICLAKVLYSKRYRLIQTDRIVLCLALSELCLVLIDTPTEIYRFLSYSFTHEWLCHFHTFFEALFSSCIIFYHLLGAFDRFVYIHGHTSSKTSAWSKLSRRISTKSGSIILLVLPIICSLPLAICNSLHANILHTYSANKICIVQYTHGILISLLILFYILPLLFSFFLHGKLIYFIRTRHKQYYLTTTAFMLPMKRGNTVEFQSKKRAHKETINPHSQGLLPPKSSSHRRLVMFNTYTTGSTTTTTMQSAPLNTNQNNSSNSSQSSRSSTATTSPIVLYKINSQANANANRTVLLLVLLLSFYVFCWAPYNIYTWHHVYKLTKSPLSNNSTLSNDFNETQRIFLLDDLSADLRRIIFLNYSLYLLSMISMCFSFIFYFSLNKQARYEFTRFIKCICPWIAHTRTDQKKKKCPNQRGRIQYRKRFQNQYSYNNERIKASPPLSRNERCNYRNRMNYSPPKAQSKRTDVNYECQIQCCT